MQPMADQSMEQVEPLTFTAANQTEKLPAQMFSLKLFHLCHGQTNSPLLSDESDAFRRRQSFFCAMHAHFYMHVPPKRQSSGPIESISPV